MRKPPQKTQFPFSLEAAIDRICGECGAESYYDPDTEEEINPCPGKDRCRYYRMRVKELKELHERVVKAERPLTPWIEEPDICELCDRCAFAASVQTHPGSYWEPPEYGLFCQACQELVEDEWCEGRFFLQVTDSESIGDIEPEEIR